jgi:uncharacterized protein (TIGR03437 family)
MATRVGRDGVVTAELDSPVQSVAPAIITTDGSVNSHDNPAAPESVVSFYLTGLGPYESSS